MWMSIRHERSFAMKQENLCEVVEYAAGCSPMQTGQLSQAIDNLTRMARVLSFGDWHGMF